MEFDGVVNRELILASWKERQMSAEQAWFLLEQHGSFKSKTLALMNYDMGISALQALSEMMNSDNAEMRSLASDLIHKGKECGSYSEPLCKFLTQLFDLDGDVK